MVQYKRDTTLDATRIPQIITRFYEATPFPSPHFERPHQITLLFHGPPGAGKTEFAKYVSDTTGHQLKVERVSDLVSKWVGDTEKNLANVFRKAAEERTILLLDEFDSLGFDRNQAPRSWEFSMVNELLQQIENFRGVLIACTNLVKRLDPAMARRFSFKIGFGGIDRRNRINTVESYFSSFLQNEPLNPDLVVRLEALQLLFAGDLCAVRRRLMSEAWTGSLICEERIVSAIERESEFRNGGKRPIGFSNEPRMVSMKTERAI